MGRTAISNIVIQMEKDLFFIYETPIGSINGSNQSFTLTYAPNPTKSFILTLNGSELSETEDYTLVSDVITLNTAPPTGSILKAQYHVTPT